MSQDTAQVRACAAAVTEGAVGLHAGLAFRDADNVVRILHLAMHHRLRCDDPSGWTWLRPAIDEIDLRVLAGFCVTLTRAMPRIPYGFRFSTSHFDSQGRYIPGTSDSGLTCSTFVLAIFEWARVPLLALETWAMRDEDELAQARLVEALRTYGAAPEHIAVVETERGSIRYRPEEVTGSTASSRRPVEFARAERIGAQVLAHFVAGPSADRVDEAE